MSKESSLKTIITQGFEDVAYIWKHEIKSVFKDEGVLIFFFIVPLLYPLLYAFIYTNEVVKEVPVVAIDEDHSSLSREFLRKVDATQDVKIIAYCTDMEEAKQLLRENVAHGIIRIPSEFSANIENINKWSQACVTIYADMSSMFYYKNLYLASSEVSLAMNKNIKITRLGATTKNEESVITYPIEYQGLSMYNPVTGYSAFLIPAVLILVLQQTIVLGVGMLAGTAVDKNYFHKLVPINRHYHGTLCIVLGKGLCYFMIYAVMGVWVLLVIPYLFDLPLLIHYTEMLLFLFVYLLSIIFFSMTVSVLVRNREKTIILFAFMSVPLLFLSGISWPSSAMPIGWKLVSYFFPSTFGINGFVKLNSMSASLSEISIEYHALWIQTGIYFILTCVVYRWQIIISRFHSINNTRRNIG